MSGASRKLRLSRWSCSPSIQSTSASAKPRLSSRGGASCFWYWID